MKRQILILAVVSAVVLAGGYVYAGEVESTPTQRLLPLQTFTPTPGTVATPGSPSEVEAASDELAIGDTAVVTNAAGGLNMRAGAGTGHARTKTLPEGSVLEVIGGPREANGYTWWQVRDEAGVSGWVADEWLTAQ